MRLPALITDIFQICGCAIGHNLIDLAEAQGGLQSTCQADGLRRLALRQFTDDLECGLHHLHGKTYGVWKLRIQEQKFRHTQWPDICRIYLAVGLEGRATLEQSNPFQVFRAFHSLVRRMKQAAEVSPYQRCQHISPFNKTPPLNIVPTLPVTHGRVRDALKQMNSLLYGTEECLGKKVPAI